MKRYLLLIILLAISIPGLGQNNNEISLLYGKSTGPAAYCALRSGLLDGNSSGSLRDNNIIGIRYVASIKNQTKMRIETGIDYLTGKLEIEPAITDPDDHNPRVEQFKLTSIPFFVNHYFGKYFFINEGIMFDLQKSATDNYNGFGAGIGFGIGAKYDYNNFTLYLNSKCRKHLFLSEKYGLVELGVTVGVGYKF